MFGGCLTEALRHASLNPGHILSRLRLHADFHPLVKNILNFFKKSREFIFA